MLEWPITFWPRIALLLALLFIVALTEFIIRKRAAVRWKEYLFLILAASAGAIFGILIDQVTSRISPEYFLYIKSLDPENFAIDLIDLGAKAGLVGGAIAGCIFLLANSFKNQKTWPRFRFLLIQLRYPFFASIIAALTLGFTFYWTLPDKFLSSFAELVDDNSTSNFKSVIGAHYGLYVGGIIGTILGVMQIRKNRQSVSP